MVVGWKGAATQWTRTAACGRARDMEFAATRASTPTKRMEIDRFVSPSQAATPPALAEGEPRRGAMEIGGCSAACLLRWVMEGFGRTESSAPTTHYGKAVRKMAGYMGSALQVRSKPQVRQAFSGGCAASSGRGRAKGCDGVRICKALCRGRCLHRPVGTASQICDTVLSPTAHSFPSCRKRMGRKGALMTQKPPSRICSKAG